MKICTICKEYKNVSEYNKNKCKPDGLNNLCKICSQQKSRNYYKDNREKHVQVITKRKKIVIEENKKYIVDYLRKNPCIDCHESDIVVLDFDHQKDKRDNISRMLAEGHSKKTIINEIEKCVVRCANCHRRKTAKDQNWYRLYY